MVGYWNLVELIGSAYNSIEPKLGDVAIGVTWLACMRECGMHECVAMLWHHTLAGLPFPPFNFSSSFSSSFPSSFSSSASITTSLLSPLLSFFPLLLLLLLLPLLILGRCLHFFFTSCIGAQ
jgi:hypothetical protein